MTIYIGYNRRSFSTARALKDYFKSRGQDCRIINDKRFKKKPSAFIRWGNSYKEVPEGVKEINSMESVKRASNKLLMAYTLTNAEGVNFPKAYISPMAAATLGETLGLQHEDGGYQVSGFLPMENDLDLYYRNSAGIVVRRNRHVQGDLYATEPIDRAAEFRVHVFNGRTIGVYEKVPQQENVVYCKNENCDFVRLDMANDENRDRLIGVRPMARAAVESLGLTFGGADVIISKGGEIFVNEVNSAPSLNEPNLERYYNLFMEIINEDQ